MKKSQTIVCTGSRTLVMATFRLGVAYLCCMKDGNSKSFLRNVSLDLRMYSGVSPAESQNCDDN